MPPLSALLLALRGGAGVPAPAWTASQDGGDASLVAYGAQLESGGSDAGQRRSAALLHAAFVLLA